MDIQLSVAVLGLFFLPTSACGPDRIATNLVKLKLVSRSDQSEWKFLMENRSSFAKTVTVAFPPNSDEPFTPGPVSYEFLSGGSWKTRELSDDSVYYERVMKPGEQREFVIWMVPFDSLPKGTSVRIGIAGARCDPIKW